MADAYQFPYPDRCVFCGIRGIDTPQGKLTSEHAVPDWVRNRIKPAPTVKWELDGVLVEGQDTFDVEIEAVCHDCNTGWLSRKLENKVSKWIGGALTDAKYQFQLDRPQRCLLACWAAKTALLSELALRKQLPDRTHALAPESHFKWLFDHREALKPPPGCQVWMFGVNIGSGLGWHRLAWNRGGTLDPLPELKGVPRAYFHTFTVGALGFQVFGSDLDGLDLTGGKEPPKLPVLPAVRVVLHNLWPAPNKPPFRWPPKPPKKWVDPAGLDTLASWPDYLPRLPPPQSREAVPHDLAS